MEKVVNNIPAFVEKVDLAPNFRYERKFTVEQGHKADILQAIRRHPAQFREIFHQRQINNIYLDTPELKFYINNEIGVAHRKKVRIRWYGDTFGQAQSPTLEYKLKAGLVGDKWGFQLNDFQIQPGFRNQTLRQVFDSSDLPGPVREDLRFLNPTLVNTYSRNYFLSADGQFRLTVDQRMAYYRIDHPSSRFFRALPDPTSFIIELKYKPEADQFADKVAQHIPYRLNKSSKYVNGVVALSLMKPG